ncbi:aldo/keto reductase [Bacillus sonorensis]|uniref:aldo/keto reductase n=1 Tax=Bacillus sonorensis TaxID=119858 RepID=UPI000495DE9D|nr:aldo/keto reductase [Bacillus sonorensis]MCY7859466.1 aldo/keto reductase [Bacillus sonorensis]MCY8403580.1 aldo/keto reductase [Bacillus sonorensis]MCZ0070569.1 aldo/keto reductase [Bacillus sonorensis]MCZ0097957.1 aldo/keto reductase [Bacillus sonorensis]MEC1356155.1 aldo/keto reductase [Bacillus sonorensis]
MKYNRIANTDLQVSNLIMGNMRLTELSVSAAEKLIRTAMEENINFFDHADIYGSEFVGQCEEHFAKAVQMNAGIREKMVLQTKCGINSAKNYYDFSKEHIIDSANNSLNRLKTDYLDILLLHRPDPLMDPEEVAEAFDELHASGKVRYFGVSNHNPAQIQLLEKYIRHKVVVNQLQFSIAHTPLIDAGIALNMGADQAINRDSSILEYCRLHDITVQAWSPFQTGFFKGPFLGDHEKFPKLNEVIEQIARKYDVPNTAIAVAWITTHPADIQVVLGTTKMKRMKDACKGSEIKLTREEWYEIYKAAGNIVP